MSAINKTHTHGFTLVEVLIVTPALLLVIAGMLAILIVMLQHNTAARGTLNASYQNQAALDIIDNDIRFSSRFLVALDPSPIADSYGSNNAGQAWSYKDYDSQHRVLIVRSYSSTNNLLSDSRLSVYKNELGCTGMTKFANPTLQYNAVYFIKNGTLFKRTIVDRTTALCDTQYQQQSCPIDVSYPRNALCKADDEVLLKNAQSLSVQYYSAASDATPIDAFTSSDATILDTAQSILITLTSSTTVSGEPITSTLLLRANKLNL
ncbi:hypothetical protein H7Y40_00765 [Pedobacter sp.]|nr:hypothetical protein [Candidatus Saccharibacteria bacterium]